MSQLQAVLRRSVSHLDPEDGESRKRVFESARAAMVRLLFSYEPSLSTSEINRKIGEFDRIVSEIEQGMEPAEDEIALAEAGRYDMTRRTRAPFTMRERSASSTDWPEDDGLASSAPTMSRASLPTASSPTAFSAAEEPEIDYDQEAPDDEVDDRPYEEPEQDDHGDRVYQDDRYDDEDGSYEQSRSQRLTAWARGVSGRTVALSIGGALLLVAILWGAGLAYSILSNGSDRSAQSIDAGSAVAATTPAQTDQAPLRTVTTSVEHVAPPALPTGALALETLVLFDGRDPTVFQSAPDNPVHFEGDTDGGFVRISSSTVSTGTRLVIGRGVFERLAGRTIRMVVVGRGNKQSPAHGLRFAYQNGRTLSPWIDVSLSDGYAPLSGIWTVPKSRGGPESDALIIEPGIPGDGTAADVRSVRLEVLS